MARSIVGALGFLVLASACTTSPSRSHDVPDATSAAELVGPPSARAVDVVTTLARIDALAPNLRAGRPLERFDDRFRPKRHAWSSADVSLPAHAASPLRIEARTSGAWIEVAAVDVTDVDAQSTTTALVFPGARAATDVVLVATPDGAEELRLLRSKEAPTDARWRIHAGPGIGTVRVHQGRIEALDHAGVARVVADPPFAIDARGTRRELTVQLEAVDDAWLATATLDATGLEYPIAVDPTWRLGSLELPTLLSKVLPAALPSGKIAFFGEGPGAKPLAYDPRFDTWTSNTAPLTKAISEPWIVRLSTGNVLVGFAGSVVAELWNETSGTIATPTMIVPRGGEEMQPVHVDAGLPTEAVYLFGGRPAFGSSTYHATAERYSVASGTFVSIASMPTARVGAATALLPGNKILIAGGSDSSGPLNTALLYDIATDSYELIGSTMPNTHRGGTAFVLGDGKVLIVGGWATIYDPTYKTTLYDVATKTFSDGPPMAYHRTYFAWAKLPEPGKWMVMGGNGKLVGTSANGSLSSVEIYDETENTWSAGPAMNVARERHAAAPLSGGRILVAGNLTSGPKTYEIYQRDPVACTTSGPGCPNCVDGFCCDSPCTGQCEACDMVGREGICHVVVGEPPHGSRPACSPSIVCGPGGACQTTCASDGACASGDYCASGVCAPKKANGAACTLGSECVSGTCVDGVCCDAACDGQCQACDVPGSAGTCTNVVGLPRGSRAPCAAGYACDGAGACTSACSTDTQCAPTHHCGPGGVCILRMAQGATCTRDGECTTGHCVDGYCCNTACTGTCQACDVSGNQGKCTDVANGSPRTGKSCGAYATCVSGACATSCTSDTQCTPGHYCLSGACVAKKANGAACGTPDECASGFCADGVCCDGACTGECQTCKLAGSEGSCRPKPSTTPCGLAGCVGSNRIDRGTCSGVDDRCVLGAIEPCPNGLKCADAFVCKTSCTTGADCVTGVCDTETGACTTAWDGGLPDAGDDVSTPDTSVPDTSVPDTSVPDTSVSDTSEPDTSEPDTSEPDTSVPDTSEPDTFAPDTSEPDGAVTDTAEPEDTRPIADAPAPQLPVTPEVPGEFQRCTKNSECATGFCVEGVCCDSPCDQPCHSCALLTSPGKCTLEPVGVDLKNDCGPAYTCLGTCGPKGECIGAGNGTMCGRNRCVGPTSGVGPAYCSAPGSTCPVDDAVPFECTPYVCEPAFGACRTTCATSADCANGYVCDIPSKTCIAASVPAADDGGCAVSEPGASRGGALVALGVALAGVAARRRRRSARI